MGCLAGPHWQGSELLFTGLGELTERQEPHQVDMNHDLLAHTIV
jgi:hypothetical protein